MTAPSRAEDLTTGVTVSLKAKNGRMKKPGGGGSSETRNKRMSFNLAIRRIRSDSPLYPPACSTPDAFIRTERPITTVFTRTPVSPTSLFILDER